MELGEPDGRCWKSELEIAARAPKLEKLTSRLLCTPEFEEVRRGFLFVNEGNRKGAIALLGGVLALVETMHLYSGGYFWLLFFPFSFLSFLK